MPRPPESSVCIPRLETKGLCQRKHPASRAVVRCPAPGEGGVPPLPVVLWRSLTFDPVFTKVALADQQGSPASLVSVV
jgi:hypothetical protein